MSFSVYDSRFDVAIVAGPRVTLWPSIGVRVLSAFCTEMGLTVGLFGGASVSVRGVIPSSGTGGIVLAEDMQKRIHRVQTRAVVRVSAPVVYPKPFPGWRSDGLVPQSTADQLYRESIASWFPTVAILGTGNAALRFGSKLLEEELTREVIAIESSPELWGEKQFSGWEVEWRRFQMLGGKHVEAQPLSLVKKSPLLWEFKVQDTQGVRILDVARVVSAGPFVDLPGVREHPPGSALYEIDQTAGDARAENVEGWEREEARARWLGASIVRALVADLGEKRDPFEKQYRRARQELRSFQAHRDRPFVSKFQGKWTEPQSLREIRDFPGQPKSLHRQQPIAAIECFEEIGCDHCQKICPTRAIDLSARAPDSGRLMLNESACTACGLCLAACPSQATLLVHERGSHELSDITLPWHGKRKFKVGDLATVLNRRGEPLSNVRVIELPQIQGGRAEHADVQLVKLAVPAHLVWEARGLRRPKKSQAEDEAFVSSQVSSSRQGERVEVLLDGEKRLVRDDLSLSVALFEIGRSRPEDNLLCSDGSCRLCAVMVDGVKKLACQTRIHRGMSIRLTTDASAETYLCPCLKITREEVIERLRAGHHHSPESLLAATHVGEGKCHGMICRGAFRRLLMEQGVDAEGWVDWRFPWFEWVLGG
jgi:ferredoxin